MISVFFKTELYGQDSLWYKVNASPFVICNSPFVSRVDCYGQQQIRWIPCSFDPHFEIDSLFISKDFKQVRVVFRYFGRLDQIDTNDITNYSPYDSLNFPIKTYGKKMSYKQFDGKMYMFNYTKESFNDYTHDSLLMYMAEKLHDKKCQNNFPFGDCRTINYMRDYYTGQTWTFNSKKNKMVKTAVIPNCHLISSYMYIRADASPITITLPLRNLSVGYGWPYIEINEYLKSWDSVLNTFIKPMTGSYDSKEKQWLINYDQSSNTTKGHFGLYNGGTDTLFINQCYTSAGNAIIERYPAFIAPASMGFVYLSVINNDRLGQVSSIMIDASPGSDRKKMLYRPIQFRLH